MNTKHKTALVTGGAGFIGSHLIEALLKGEKYNAISLDDYSAGTKDNHQKGAEYVKGHTKDISKKISQIPDIIFHLGEYARVEQSFNDVPRVLESNVVGTTAVAEFCRINNVKLIYAGSSTKFADNGLGRGQSPYAWTKTVNSELIRNYGNWFNLPYAITYFYNVYGPRERTVGEFGTVIAEFAKRHTGGKPLKVTSPGTQRRIFTHVNDIVSGLILIAEKGEGDDYGLGATRSYTMLEIANMFCADVEMLPNPRGNRMNSTIDTTKTEELGWSAKNDIREYIKDIVANKEE